MHIKDLTTRVLLSIGCLASISGYLSGSRCFWNDGIPASRCWEHCGGPSSHSCPHSYSCEVATFLHVRPCAGHLALSPCVNPFPQFRQFGICCLLPTVWFAGCRCTAPTGSAFIVGPLSFRIPLRSVTSVFVPETTFPGFDLTMFASDFWFSRPLSHASAVFRIVSASISSTKNFFSSSRSVMLVRNRSLDKFFFYVAKFTFRCKRL